MSHQNNIHVVPVEPTFLQESGLTVFTPTSNPEYSIQGDDSQVLTLSVAPNQQIQAEPGAMCFAVSPPPPVYIV